MLSPLLSKFSQSYRTFCPILKILEMKMFQNCLLIVQKGYVKEKNRFILNKKNIKKNRELY